MSPLRGCHPRRCRTGMYHVRADDRDWRVCEPPVLTEHKRLTAVCPHCRRRVHGKMPTGNSTKTSYGPKVQVVVVYLFVMQSMLYNRIAEMMQDAFGLENFSDGTVKNILSRNTAKAKSVYMALLSRSAPEWTRWACKSTRRSAGSGACNVPSTASCSPTPHAG